MRDSTQGLIAFVRTAETGSFSNAAKRLGTTPSAVSKSVARVEARLNVRLFQRSTRTLSLTQEGAAYYERIAPILRAMEDASDALLPLTAAQGSLKVSVSGDLGHLLMASLTREFVPHHPDLKLEFSMADRHVDLIREGFDIAVRAGEMVDSDLTARLLARLPLVLAASPSYLGRYGEPQNVESLGDHLHIHYLLNGKPYPISFADGRRWLPHGKFDTDSGIASRIAALNGLGVVQILRFAIQDDLKTGALRVVLPSVALSAVSVYALHAFGKHVPVRARLFIDFLAGQMGARDFGV